MVWKWPIGPMTYDTLIHGNCTISFDTDTYFLQIFRQLLHSPGVFWSLGNAQISTTKSRHWCWSVRNSQACCWGPSPPGLSELRQKLDRWTHMAFWKSPEDPNQSCNWKGTTNNCTNGGEDIWPGFDLKQEKRAKTRVGYKFDKTNAYQTPQKWCIARKEFQIFAWLHWFSCQGRVGVLACSVCFIKKGLKSYTRNTPGKPDNSPSFTWTFLAPHRHWRLGCLAAWWFDSHLSSTPKCRGTVSHGVLVRVSFSTPTAHIDCRN